LSEFHIKGVLDRWGGIDWVLFHHSTGLARPLAVIADYEFTRLQSEMAEQRVDLERGKKQIARIIRSRGEASGSRTSTK
jgi:hypothetical protein